jgi:hypothetical protein
MATAKKLYGTLLLKHLKSYVKYQRTNPFRWFAIGDTTRENMPWIFADRKGVWNTACLVNIDMGKESTILAFPSQNASSPVFQHVRRLRLYGINKLKL